VPGDNYDERVSVTWRPVPHRNRWSGWNADGEIVHAADTTDFAAAFRGASELAGDRPRVGRGAQHGARLPGLAAHARRYGGPRHGTQPDHMPSAHRRYAEWSPERFQRQARAIGPNTEALIMGSPHDLYKIVR
jgi:hypothetical protein